MNVGKNVGEQIRRRRENKGLTQVEVADYAGVTPSMICQVERGKKELSLKASKDVADLLECTVDDLLAENKED